MLEPLACRSCYQDLDEPGEELDRPRDNTSIEPDLQMRYSRPARRRSDQVTSEAN